ncbi:MAG TPA: twin-arginine translocase TatA/TatE family subunit [Pyrinomonadaceae bacterium]|jgi:sec-independent protein translocase protein TatA|nr:twin-arginine translocase TatA/TatE family subunit [Pyrinomonadaceae bacterium]
MNFGPWELIIILVILLLLFGSTRLPSLARGMGKSISEFKKGISEGGKEDAAQLADSRRSELRDADRARADDTADSYTVNKPRT